MFLFSPKFDWSFSHLPKSNWSCCTLPKCSYFTQIFGYHFASVWKIDTTSLTCECSCILCPNFETFCPINGQFFNDGDATASPASPCRTLMIPPITKPMPWNTRKSFAVMDHFAIAYLSPGVSISRKNRCSRGVPASAKLTERCHDGRIATALNKLSCVTNVSKRAVTEILQLQAESFFENLHNILVHSDRVFEMQYISKPLTVISTVINVASKKILHWANVCFSKHEYFLAELTEF